MCKKHWAKEFPVGLFVCVHVTLGISCWLQTCFTTHIWRQGSGQALDPTTREGTGGSGPIEALTEAVGDAKTRGSVLCMTKLLYTISQPEHRQQK